MCTPPSSTIRRASAAYSSGVYGIAAHWSRLASEPEIEQVMTTGSSSAMRFLSRKWEVSLPTLTDHAAKRQPKIRASRFGRERSITVPMHRSRDLRLSNVGPAALVLAMLAVPGVLLGLLGSREVDDLYVTHLLSVGA